jgi:hypothetical protein
MQIDPGTVGEDDRIVLAEPRSAQLGETPVANLRRDAPIGLFRLDRCCLHGGTLAHSAAGRHRVSFGSRFGLSAARL